MQNIYNRQVDVSKSTYNYKPNYNYGGKNKYN